MRILRTPDSRFDGLDGFEYPVRFAEVDGGLRMAYIEDGPADGPPVLLLHGEPTWSYLWRSVVPVLSAAGLRAIAPDLVGFGRSDKPAEVGDHSYARHVEWMRAFAFDVLNLHDVTVVGHDWGGLIGLRLVTEHPERVGGVVATNTGLPTGDQRMPDAWLRFRDMVATAPELDVARMVASGCRRPLQAAAITAYAAPFPNADLMAGPRAMPALVPARPDDPASAANRIAWQRLSAWDKPFLVAYTDSDPITTAMAPVLTRRVPGARRIELAGGGHFVQEDCGPELAEAIAGFVTGYAG